MRVWKTWVLWPRDRRAVQSPAAKSRSRGSSDVAKEYGGGNGDSTARIVSGRDEYNRISPQGIVKHIHRTSQCSLLRSSEQTERPHEADAGYAAGGCWSF